MEYSSHSHREEHRGGGLGLGWVIAFSVGGMILLFGAIGFLLAWRCGSRTDHSSTTVNQVSKRDGHRRSIFTKHLLRYRNAKTKPSSQLSLSLPSVLPPLASHNSFPFFNSTGNSGRSSSWVDEDRFYGPGVRRSRRDDLLSMDSRLGRMPMPQSVMLDDNMEKGQLSELLEQSTDLTHLRGRQSIEMSNPSNKRPELPTPEQDIHTSGTGRLLLAPIRASTMDFDLRDILHYLDQRLEGGKSQSPTKTPQVSPLKCSPKILLLKGTPRRSSILKTPRSHKTACDLCSTNTAGAVHISHTIQSPSARSTIYGVPRSGYSQTTSVSSHGSAANNLLAKATHGFGPPKELSSPTLSRGHQWWQSLDGHSPQNGQSLKKKSIKKDSPERRESQDNETSHSPSTLYSANEPEDEAGPDPFMEETTAGASSSESRFSLFKLRSPRGQIRTPGIPTPGQPSVFSTQDNPTSASTEGAHRLPLFLMVQLQQEYPRRYISFSSQDRQGFALMDPTATSMVSIAMPSMMAAPDEGCTIHLDYRRSESPKSGVSGCICPQSQDRNSLVTAVPTSPSTMASSPFDEEDMLSLLMGTIAPPQSPDHEDKPVVHDASVISTGSPLRHSLSRSLKEPPAGPPPAIGGVYPLRDSIMELRRMGSMDSSSYSATSVASSPNERNLLTLAPSLSGNFSHERLNSNARMSMSSRQNYLNLGNPRKVTSSPVSAAITAKPVPSGKSSRYNRGVKIPEDDADVGKEKQGSDIEVPRLGAAIGLHEARHRGNAGHDTRDSSLTMKMRSSPSLEL